MRRVGSSQSARRRLEGRWIYFNTLRNSGEDTNRDHHVIACTAFQIPVMCSLQFPPSKVPEDNPYKEQKDQLFDPWYLLYSEDHLSQIIPCGPWTLMLIWEVNTNHPLKFKVYRGQSTLCMQPQVSIILERDLQQIINNRQM